MLAGVLDDASDPAEVSSVLRQVGDYEILGELGRGAMGIVYRARQRGLDRTVAVKLVLGGAWASEAAMEGLRTEARAAAALRHPQIVAVHEVGEHEGQPFFSMDLVEGRSLAAVLREGPLPPEHAAELVESLAEAMHFAHERGIIHRDLKPSNVLIDAAGRPYITDFGLAKNLADGAPTIAGAALGTPGYMPPEQLRHPEGPQAPASPAGDVYSLGAILYALLTGLAPFRGATPIETMLKVLRSEPLAPRQLDDKIPRDLEKICLKCLEREPGRRYSSALELALDLGRFLASEPVMARTLGPLERLVRWCRRNPWPTGVVVVAIFLLVAATALYLESRRQRFASLLEHAQAQRLAGDRGGALASLTAASSIERTPELVREEILALRLPEVRLNRSIISDDILTLAFADHGRQLVTLTTGGIHSSSLCNLEVWDLAHGERREQVTGESVFGESRRSLWGENWPMVRVGPQFLQVRYWNPVAGEIHALELATEKVPAARWIFDHTGSRAVFAVDQDIHLWDARTRELVVLPVWGKPLAFLDDGRLLYRLGGNLHAFDVEAGQTSSPVPPVPALAVASDGSQALLAAAQPEQLEVWDILSQSRIAVLPDGEEEPSQILLSTDGGLVALGSTENSRGLRLWDVAAPRRGARPLRLSSDRSLHLERASFSPDGLLLATPGRERERDVVWLWDVRRGTEVAALRDQKQAAWNPAGGQLVTRGPAPEKKITLGGPKRSTTWSVPQNALTLWEVISPLPRFDAGPVSQLSFSLDGRRLAAGEVVIQLGEPGGGSYQIVHEASNGQQVHFDPSGRLWEVHLPRPPRGPLPLGLQRLEPLAEPAELRWQAFSGLPFANSPHKKAVETWPFAASVAFAPDGHRLAVVSNLLSRSPESAEMEATGFALELYDTLSGERRRWLNEATPNEQFLALAWSPDGSRLATVGTGPPDRGAGEVSLWDATSGTRLLVPDPVPDLLLTALAWSADGRSLGVGSIEGMLGVVELEPEGQRFWPSDHGTVRVLTIDPTGRWIASAGEAPEIALWELRSGQEVGRWEAHEVGVTALAFAPDGGRLVSAGGDGQVAVWDLTFLDPEDGEHGQ